MQTEGQRWRIGSNSREPANSVSSLGLFYFWPPLLSYHLNPLLHALSLGWGHLCLCVWILLPWSSRPFLQPPTTPQLHHQAHLCFRSHLHRQSQRVWLIQPACFGLWCSWHAVLCLVGQSCLTLCDLMDCSPPGSSVMGILQTRILEWVAMPSSRGSSQLRDWTQVSCIAGGFFTI